MTLDCHDALMAEHLIGVEDGLLLGFLFLMLVAAVIASASLMEVRR